MYNDITRSIFIFRIILLKNGENVGVVPKRIENAGQKGSYRQTERLVYCLMVLYFTASIDGHE